MNTMTAEKKMWILYQKHTFLDPLNGRMTQGQHMKDRDARHIQMINKFSIILDIIEEIKF